MIQKYWFKHVNTFALFMVLNIISRYKPELLPFNQAELLLKVITWVSFIGLVTELSYFGYKITNNKRYLWLGLFGISFYLALVGHLILYTQKKKYMLAGGSRNSEAEVTMNDNSIFTKVILLILITGLIASILYVFVIPTLK